MLRRITRILMLLIGLTVAVACGSSSTVTPETGATERGEASYYADKFVGRQTASGETYTHDALTAAHRTLPFGTRVRVRRIDTDATVVVRINDRGPFKPGRIIDLSKEAARQIGLLRAGVAEVEITVLKGNDTASDSDPRPERSRQDDDTSTSW